MSTKHNGSNTTNFLKTVEILQNFLIQKSFAEIWNLNILYENHCSYACGTYHQPLVDEHISPIIKIKDDDTKLLKYPVPNGKVKKSEKYVSQDIFSRNGPQTMTSIKKT